MKDCVACPTGCLEQPRGLLDLRIQWYLGSWFRFLLVLGCLSSLIQSSRKSFSSNHSLQHIEAFFIHTVPAKAADAYLVYILGRANRPIRRFSNRPHPCCASCRNRIPPWILPESVKGAPSGTENF